MKIWKKDFEAKSDVYNALLLYNAIWLSFDYIFHHDMSKLEAAWSNWVSIILGSSSLSLKSDATNLMSDVAQA